MQLNSLKFRQYLYLCRSDSIIIPIKILKRYLNLIQIWKPHVDLRLLTSSCGKCLYSHFDHDLIKQKVKIVDFQTIVIL